VRYLPASTLAEDVDHMAKPLGAFQPVLLQSGLHAIRIALFYSFDNVFVLFNGDMKIFDDRTRVQTPVPLCLRLNRSMQSQQTSTRAAVHNQTMKVPIQIEDLSLLTAAAFRYLKQSLIELSKLDAYLCPLPCRQRRNPAPRDAFKTSDDQVQLIRIFFRQRRNDHARLADVPMLKDVPLPLQPVDGAANRGSAHVQPFGQVGFQNPCSGRKPPVHDQFANLAKSRQQAGTVFCLGALDWGGCCFRLFLHWLQLLQFQRDKIVYATLTQVHQKKCLDR
jgi:hypothetical protein